MDDRIARRLRSAGIDLLPQAPPRHPYEVATRDGDTLYVSGKTAMRDGAVVYAGSLAGAGDISRGQEAARLCTIQLLSALDAVVGLECVDRVLKLTVFVASASEFTGQALVANAASELLRKALGDAGTHARSAVGVAALPGGSTVEVEAVVRVRAEAA
ncbi:RidA family protein [Microbacterium pseudoresistens]|uniref:Enamine deaminase RidA (YjgF/YER057c/UK114 family) n=1 Tax=Microbacterium pseudoresistens TaxID=640634 RepID=A0A7Y9EUH9_9MICO|nr:RidA family protein [Microbacterium pseudoresistens]NYD53300.1 enamine deaminase RidA (YjgF/YER057c/UK114 family) [Microbacterium pseudoresistens]